MRLTKMVRLIGPKLSNAHVLITYLLNAWPYRRRIFTLPEILDDGAIF